MGPVELEVGDMRVSVLWHTSEFRGDHSSDVVQAYEPLPGETVDELVKRLMACPDGTIPASSCFDWIELRPVWEERKAQS